ncbi:DUF3347 domain-containing protein [Muricauda sp. SCSIO 64092]|uniref:DUF3347 domain-containing protein n=1 Tax=Allomuricauda sp. SCSIO 64092 TaxID=2908842 RepID=UPI001FF223D2|nr:DUF3347 domain-containing protein [Muricauda sp. SCSIO 64092]UOY06787.1 DUF3347 domain-containing protein [Muricauda sp. SCSIO 64092]
MKSKIQEYLKTNKLNVSKTLFKTTLLIIVITGFISCKNESKQGNPKSSSNNEVAQTMELAFTNETIGKQFQHYIHLKTALVNTDVNEARSGAKMLMENTDDAASKEMLSKISESDDIEVQRTVFSDVTEKMGKLVKGSLSSGEVYQQFCPMAFNNKGGYWLSTEEEIRNPYFGDRMLKCGKVTETIRK